MAALEKIQTRLQGELGESVTQLRGQIDSTVATIASLERAQKSLSADTHQWLALQSLGISFSDARTARFIPLQVYLSETPDDAISRVTGAVNDLLDAFGFTLADEFPEVRGSWFKRWFARGKDFMSQPEVTDRLEKLERAIELKGLGQPQADIDAKQAGAVAQLTTALSGIPNAAIQVGSILFIKLTSGDSPAIHVRTLSQQELIHLENNQEMLASPADILERLSKVCQAQTIGRDLTSTTQKKKLSKRRKVAVETTDPHKSLASFGVLTGNLPTRYNILEDRDGSLLKPSKLPPPDEK